MLCFEIGFPQSGQPRYKYDMNMNIQIFKYYSNQPNHKLQNPLVRNFNQLLDFYISDGWHILSSPARLNRKSAWRLSAVLAAGGLIYAFDQKILDGYRRSWEHPAYKFFAKTGEALEPMGQIEKMNPYCVVGFAVGYVFKINRLQKASIQIIESLSIASGFKQIIREIVGRARPSENLGPRFFKFTKGESFPSGHASNAFQVATILSYHVNYLPFTLICYGLATSIGFWRIDNSLHWASDVFLGAAYGTAVSTALIKFHEKRKIKVIPKIFMKQNTIGFGMTYIF